MVWGGGSSCCDGKLVYSTHRATRGPPIWSLEMEIRGCYRFF